MLNRMIGAARLDVDAFEEVEADTGASLQAMAVVALVSLATGLGALGAGGDLSSLVVGIVFGLVTWAVWAFLTFIIGTKLLSTPETRANWSELARTTGFAQSPGVFRIFGFIPFIGPAIFLASYIWQLVAMVIAVRQALDYRSTWRATAVVGIGFAVVFIALWILIAAFGPASNGATGS